MKKILLITVLFCMTGTAALTAQDSLQREIITGSAFLENHSYRVLQRLCDEAGGRLVGSPQNETALGILKEELEKVGWSVRFEKFRMPGWKRENDEVVMTAPSSRKLKAVALGYVDSTSGFEAPVVYAGFGFESDYQNIQAKNKIVLVTSEKPKDKEPLLRQEAIDIAAQQGARAILFIKRKPGYLVLAGTADFQGDPAPIPAFSLNREEGLWLKRLLGEALLVSLRMTVRSYCRDITTRNVVLTLPGEVKGKIVAGAHFDSWDLGQGGIDNGLGTAILFDAARLMKKFSPENYYTVEFVWFNGEELGLFGSKNYVRMHKNDTIAAMINLDMTGAPTGFNAMGFDEMLPVLEQLTRELDGFNLARGVINRPWTNSDHQPFMLQGIPTISPLAHLDKDMARYYHSGGDTFDKVNKKYLSEAAAVVSLLIRKLANARDIKFPHLDEKQVVKMLETHHLDERLKRQGEWPFSR